MLQKCDFFSKTSCSGCTGHSRGHMCLESKPPSGSWSTISCAWSMCLVVPCSKRINPSSGSMWVSSECRNAYSFAFLGVCFYVSYLGTWEQKSSLCKVLRGLLNLHSSSSQGPHKSSDVLALPICMISSWIT